MPKWKCYRCGTVYDQETPPDTCSSCNASVSFWIDWTEAKSPLDEPVSKYMLPRLTTIDINESAWNAARLMRDNNVGSVCVTQNGIPVGIVTEWDLLKKIVAEDLPAAHVLLRKIMSTPVVSVSADTTVRKAISIMEEKKFRRLLVTKNNEAIGMITHSEFVNKAFRSTLSSV
ncbi:MAG: CBS domain-containing protein [Nitrososphaerales archaeon]